MDLKPAEITSILKKQLADYETKSETYEVGTVVSISDGIARGRPGGTHRGRVRCGN